MSEPIRIMPPPPVCKFHDYPSLVEALRTIKDYLQLSNGKLDTLCNFGEGQTDKLLGPTQARGFGPKTLDAMLWGMAIEGEFTISTERAAQMQQHWEQRCAPQVRPNGVTISKRLVERAKPLVLRDFARSGGLARANQPASKLAARKGGKKRMAKLSAPGRRALSRKGGLASAAKRREAKRKALAVIDAAPLA